MYVVTGGAGFIGSNVVAQLAQRGAAVVVVDWLHEDERWRNLARHEILDVISPEHLQPWLERQGSAVEAIVHLGANSSTTETDVDLIYRQNIARDARPAAMVHAQRPAPGLRLIGGDLRRRQRRLRR